MFDMSDDDRRLVLGEALMHELRIIREGIANLPTRPEFNELRSNVDTLQDDMNLVKGVLREHSLTLSGHGVVLTEHTVVLTEHTAMLTEHTAMLTEHTAMLTEHTAMLVDHGLKLNSLAGDIKTLQLQSA